jgi:hypothetical protein
MLMLDGVAFPPVRSCPKAGLPGRYHLSDGAHVPAARRSLPPPACSKGVSVSLKSP